MINLDQETLITALICVSFFSISLYAFLLRHNRSNVSTTFLTLFCISLGLNQLYDLLIFNQIYGGYLRFVDEFGLLIAFPSLYFYVTSLTRNPFRFQKQHLIHLAPILLFLMLWVFPLPFIKQYHNSHFLKNFYKYYNNIFGVVYFLIIYYRVNQHQQILKDLTSTTRENDLRWVSVMVGILLVIICFWTLSGFEKDPYNITGYALLLFSYWLGCHVIVQKMSTPLCLMGLKYRN